MSWPPAHRFAFLEYGAVVGLFDGTAALLPDQAPPSGFTPHFQPLTSSAVSGRTAPNRVMYRRWYCRPDHRCPSQSGWVMFTPAAPLLSYLMSDRAAKSCVDESCSSARSTPGSRRSWAAASSRATSCAVGPSWVG